MTTNRARIGQITFIVEPETTTIEYPGGIGRHCPSGTAQNSA